MNIILPVLTNEWMHYGYLAGKVHLAKLGDSSLSRSDYPLIYEEATRFMLECYGLSNCDGLHDARVKAWEKKIKRNALEAPKLCPLPPTEAAFKQNVLRAHLATATMLDCLKEDAVVLEPTEHGWFTSNDSNMLRPTIVEQGVTMAPTALLKLI